MCLRQLLNVGVYVSRGFCVHQLLSWASYKFRPLGKAAACVHGSSRARDVQKMRDSVLRIDEVMLGLGGELKGVDLVVAANHLALVTGEMIFSIAYSSGGRLCRRSRSSMSAIKPTLLWRKFKIVMCCVCQQQTARATQDKVLR